MIARFTGTSAAGNLQASLRQQRIVEYNDAVAACLVDKGQLVEFEVGQALLTQNSDDQSVYFILYGQVNVYVNGRLVARRTHNETVGEMAAIDPASPRSASVVAHTKTICLRVACADFLAIATAQPAMWRAIAVLIAERLRQRERFHRTPNSHPIMFIGSSAEGLPIANAIQLGLKHAEFEVRVWTTGVFGPGGVTVDDLLAQVNQADFSVFVFGPDDKVASRGVAYDGPRDNVIFEMGLFLSQLGRQRCVMVSERGSDIKIPSDLLGVTPITYITRLGSDINVTLAPVCTELSGLVSKLGLL